MHILHANDTALAEAVSILRDGGVVIHATETCYGLACDLTNPDAVARLFAIKKRPPTQPVSALFATVEEAKKWVEWNARADELAAQYLPGPLTLILPLRADAPMRLFPTPEGGTTVGVRVSSHPLATKMASLSGVPLSTTSANIHGEANPYDPDLMVDRLAGEAELPDLMLDSGVLPPVAPSTVIDLATGEMKRTGEIAPR